MFYRLTEFIQLIKSRVHVRRDPHPFELLVHYTLHEYPMLLPQVLCQGNGSTPLISNVARPQLIPGAKDVWKRTFGWDLIREAQ